MRTTADALWALDTHVLVYATAPDAPTAKQRAAQGLMERLFAHPQGCLPGQVLSEFLSVVLRRQTMPPRLALEAVSTWAEAARVLDAPAQAYEQAWKLAAQRHYQVWDALIIAICAAHGVKTLYSEEAGSLKRPLGVQVINPFEDSAA
jgi:predicted nucleic acid-binding protein